VEVLRTDESRHLAQNPDDLSALDGVSRGAHARSLPVGDFLSIIILDSISGMIPNRILRVLTRARVRRFQAASLRQPIPWPPPAPQSGARSSINSCDGRLPNL
jgi:hypothetical protein